jgi:UDP-3-O-[3-hydroxymyristoyl] N-acetylglucosamine deacetylase
MILMQYKHTLKQEISLSGIGIHSGKNVTLKLKPSDSGEIFFIRTDLENLKFLIDPRKVITLNSSVLTSGDKKIQTIEHLMAALYMSGIDSLTIELDVGEVPIMDGSSLPFVKAIRTAGIKSLDKEKRAIRIEKPFMVEDGNGSISVKPYIGLKISYSIYYDHPLIGEQKYSIKADEKIFAREISPARTFGFLKDVPALKEKNLAQGGSLENALVLDSKGLINGPLRFPDEFVRHKILDLIGDIALLGSPIFAHFLAKRAGHKLHLKAIRFIQKHKDYWTFA